MLKKLVKDLLLPFYDHLYRFFKGIFDEGRGYRYVVFIARRCSNLAEIFFQVLEDTDETRFPPHFITDSAMLSLVPGLAELYRCNRRFPSILVVEDIVIHGKSLTAFLEELEEQLFLQLQPDGFTREEITSAVVRAVRIRAFARNNQPLLLASRYQSGFTVMKTMEPKQWRDLSNRTSRLILVSGQVNSSFVCGSRIKWKESGWPALHKAGFSRVQTTYDAFPESMFCRAVPLYNGQYVIYTVRTFPSSVDGSLVAAPFVLLPNMTEERMEALIRFALRRLRPRLGRTPLDPGGSWEGCARTRAEALTLLLSVSLLKEFSALTGSTPVYQDGIDIKLQMNFGTELNEEAKEFICRLLDPDVRLLSIDQMDRLIFGAFGIEYVRGWAGFSWVDEDAVCKESKKLKQRIEDEVYKAGMSSFADAYWKTQMYQMQRDDESEDMWDRFTSASVLMEELRDICGEKYSISQAVSWGFQMVDAGILSIAVRCFARGRRRYTAQCVKTGEQSQFVMPKRLREFVPVLILIQRRAQSMRRSFYGEFSRFAAANEDFAEHEKELIEFVNDVRTSGQDLEDWDFNLVTLPDSSSENWLKEASKALSAIQRQQRYVNEYINLIRTE